MIILILLKLIIFIKWCHADLVVPFNYVMPPPPPTVKVCLQQQQQQHHHHHEHRGKPPIFKPFLDNATNAIYTKSTIEFEIPFLDMEVQHNRYIFIRKEQAFKKHIFIVDDHHLHELLISTEEKRTITLALLEGYIRHSELLDAQIIYWQHSYILVMAFQEQLEVYQLEEYILNEYAALSEIAYTPPSKFEAIQQITLQGKFETLFLFSPAEGKIMMIVGFNNILPKYGSFAWFDTYFNQIEELTLPNTYMPNVIGSKIKYFIIGAPIKHPNSTILTIFRINPNTLKMQVSQTLTVQSRVIHIFSYRDNNIILGCSSREDKCISFRQNRDEFFSAYRQRGSKEFAFDSMVSTENFVGAIRQNQILIFTNHRLDCFSGFTIDSRNLMSLMGYQNSKNEDYLLLIYYGSRISIMQLKINVEDLVMGNQNEPEELLASTHYTHLFETTIGQLRSILLQRKRDMDVLRKVSNIMAPKIKELKVTKPVILRSGNVGILKIKGKNLRSPLKILENISTLKQSYGPLRTKRSENLNLNATIEITNQIKVNKLKVENLIYQGDVLEGFHLNHTNKEAPILYVRPRVKTNTINTTELKLVSGDRMERQQTTRDQFFVRVNHLKVDTINGIRWDEFLDSLFLKNRDKSIQGRLVLRSEVNVNHLMTTVLNGFFVSSLFNFKHAQVVHSELIISHISVGDLKANTINGLVFEEDIVFSGNDAVIETPVSIRYLRVLEDLFLADNVKVKRLENSPDILEFKQIYTNRVIINGSLVLNNLIREKGNETKIILGEVEYNENKIKNRYLLREEAQHFSFPIVFDKSKVTAPFLETNYLNGHLTEQHMLVNVANDDNPLLVVFMNALIQGDVVCRDHKSKIAEINENIIRWDDKFVEISGTKIFEASLEVNELNASHLNQISVEDLIFKSLLNGIELPLKFKDLKNFAKIKVKNPAFILKELEASYLNNLPLEDLLNSDYYGDRLQIPYLVEASNIVFHKINGIPFDDFFKKINVNNERLVLHKDLIVEGNVEFKEDLELQYLNNIAWKEYVDNLVRINENAVIEGDVSFKDEFIITKEFETADINGVDLENILKRVLLKSKPQLITGSYHFNNINTSNIDVLLINHVNATEFMYLTENLTELNGNIRVENLYIEGDLKANIIENENFRNLSEQVKSLPLRPWKNLYVLNHVSWPANLSDNPQHELMKYFYKNAVQSNKDNLITGNVKLIKPLIRNMQTRLKFPANVDFDFIQKDGLLKNSSAVQIVKSEKVFLKPLYFDKLKATNHVYTKLLNNIDILYLNQSLYRLSHPVPLKGPLKFLKPLTIENLQVNGFINGLNSSLIYQLNSNSRVPALTVYELFIDNNLQIKTINEMNMEYFLDNRVTLNGPALEHFGILTFEHLVIEKEALLQSINNIAIDNLIFKHSDDVQTITGHKKLGKFLEFQGPAHVMRLNDKDLLELYHTSLLKHHNYEFDNLLIDKATFEKGLQIVYDLNTNLQRRLFASLSNKQDLPRCLEELNKNLLLFSKDIIYLDCDLNSVIKWEKPNNFHSNNTILYELSRLSYCEKEYLQISFESPYEIYLQNITSNRLSVITNNISVKTENYCRNQHGKVKSKVSISGHHQLKVFGIKRYMESIHMLDIDNSSALVILHALDLPLRKRNEIRIFKIQHQNNSIDDWQGLVQNVGEQLKLFKLTTFKILITNGLIENQPALTIYHFNDTTQYFKLQQIIDGDYNIIEMLELHTGSIKTSHLIVTCSKCQRIFVYEFNAARVEENKYEIFQIIALKTFIDKLLVFSLKNDFYMLLISQRDGNFYNIYKYSYMQGWLHVTFGYFPNLQISVPLMELWNRGSNLSISYDSNTGIPVLLLCNFNNCYLVKIII